jgi:glycosyltransferase involved in cell wall biosynthesis
MRLLFISANPPGLGRAGGAIILYHCLKGLSARHSVDLVTFRRPDEKVPEDIQAVLGQLVILNDPGERAALGNHLRGLAHGWPLAVSRYYSPAAQATVARMMDHNHYDAVVCQLTSTAQFVPRPGIRASVLMIEDPQSVKYRYTPPWRQPVIGKVLTQFEIGRIERYEREHWPEFDRVLLLNKSDMAECRKLYPKTMFEWLSYGVDADYFSPLPDTTREDDTIVFTGQMSSPQNVEAIIAFCDKILPVILAKRPSTQLSIVGANPSPEVQALARRDPRIRVTGFVDDMRDHLRGAKVSVCPVQLGYGSRTKILEAMACGLPVVTWSATNAGVGATPGAHLLAAGTPEEFADDVLRLLESPDLWRVISTQARSFIENERSWRVVVDRLEQLLANVARNK